MPYNVLFSEQVQAVDEDSGYTTAYDSYYEFGLSKGNNFFIGSTNAAPVIAKVKTAITVDKMTFIDETYPSNGTANWPTGNKDVYYTPTLKEYSPQVIQGICVAAACCAIALALLIVTCDCFCKERKAAKIAYEKY